MSNMNDYQLEEMENSQIKKPVQLRKQLFWQQED